MGNVWAAIAAVASLLGVIVTIVVGVFYSGRQAERLNGVISTTGDHARRLDVHEARIGELDVKAGRFEEWKEGYNAASRVSVSSAPNPILRD